MSVRLRPQSAQRIATSSHAATDWLVQGWLARGVITLLSADSKAGKTELLFGLIRACFDRVPFCGLATKPVRVLILTEQTGATLYPFVRRWGFWQEAPEGRLALLRREWSERFPPQGHPGYAVQVVPWATLYQGKAPGERPSWAAVAPAGIALAVRGRYDVLCVDTLGRWITGEGGSENSNGQMLQAMGALHEAADRGLAVLVNHHNSRSGNVRGATAIEAEVDVILRLAKEIDARRGETAETTTRRLIKGSGRFQEETPPALTVRLVRGADGTPAHYEADGQQPALQNQSPPALQGAEGPSPNPPPQSGALAKLRQALERGSSAEPNSRVRQRRAPAQTVWEHPQAHAVMQALTQAGASGATAKTLCELVGEPLQSSPRKRITLYEWLGRLQDAGAVRIVGQEAPVNGGKPADVFAIAPLPWSPTAPENGAGGSRVVDGLVTSPRPSGGGRGEEAA